MRKLLAVGLLAFGVTACQSGGGESSSTTAAAGGGAGDPARGKQQFATVCVTCHGASGEGIQGLGKSLQASAYVKSKSDDELVKLINEGRPADHPENTTKVAMPPKGGNPGLGDQDIKDIVAYLRTL